MLDGLGIVGVSWRQAASADLAGFVLPSGEAGERLGAFADAARVAELAYLETCNRVELIFLRDAGAAADVRRQAFECLTGSAPRPGESERRLRAWAGEGAAEHLFLVAGGLDSVCVGEHEIVAQLRDSRRRARETGILGPRLDLLFEEAFKVAAAVRGEVGLGSGRSSLAVVAVEFVRSRIERTPGRVALVGVSPMTRSAARSLAQTGVDVVIVNRSADKARALAEECGGEWVSLGDFRARPPAVEALIAATGARGPVLTKPDLERLAAATISGQAPLVVDLAVPADLDSEACASLGIERIGMDEIVAAAERGRQRHLTEAAEARERVDRALERLRERFTDRLQGPLFGALQKRYRHTAREGVRRLLAKDLQGLGPEEREAIETWCDALARRFAHIPCLGLRGLLHSGPEGSIEAFLDGLEPELASELRCALDTGFESRDGFDG